MKVTISLPASLVIISAFTTTTALPFAQPNWRTARSVTATDVAAREPLGSIASTLLGLEALSDPSFGAAKRSTEDVVARDPWAGALVKILPHVAPIAVDVFKKIFGRDLSEDELDQEIAKALFGRSAPSEKRDVASDAELDAAIVNAILNSRSDESDVADVAARDPWAGTLVKLLPTIAPIAVDVFKKIFNRDLSEDALDRELVRAIFSRSVDTAATDIAAREPSFGSALVKILPHVAPVAVDLFRSIFNRRDVSDDVLDEAIVKAIFGRSIEASSQDLNELATLINALSR